jgi:hypothetical protein
MKAVKAKPSRIFFVFPFYDKLGNGKKKEERLACNEQMWESKIYPECNMAVIHFGVSSACLPAC